MEMVNILDNKPAQGLQRSDARLTNESGSLHNGDMQDVIGRIRSAFEVFDSQSLLLKRAYDRLRQDLAATNRKLSEKNRALSEKVWELEEMSGRLQCIIESLTDSVIVVNTGLMVERCNRAAETLLGVSRSEMIGRSYQSIINGLGDAEKLRNVFGKGTAFLDDERASLLPDKEVYVLASAAPIYSPDGDILGAVEVLRDITKVKSLEAKVELHKRMSALGQMAASVAHEIRNPLGTIEGFARLLKRDLADMPDHLRLASKIVEGAQNLNYVITNLLEYTRPAFVQSGECDASIIVYEAAETVAVKAAERRVKVDTQTLPVKFSGDARQIKQVIVNLALNAVEACEPGGAVIIKAFTRGRKCVISVEDNGSGISEEDMGRIFDPFFTKKSGGTGLGLALCHKIVTAHGGEMTVSSRQGEGSCFEVTLKHSGGEK